MTDKEALARVDAKPFPARLLPPAAVARAERMAESARLKLGVPASAVRVAYFVEGRPAAKSGWFLGDSPGVIYVRAAAAVAADDQELAGLIAHELKHLADYRAGRLGRDENLDEERACEYARKFSWLYGPALPFPKTRARNGARAAIGYSPGRQLAHRAPWTKSGPAWVVKR